MLIKNLVILLLLANAFHKQVNCCEKSFERGIYIGVSIAKILCERQLASRLVTINFATMYLWKCLNNFSMNNFAYSEPETSSSNQILTSKLGHPYNNDEQQWLDYPLFMSENDYNNEEFMRDFLLLNKNIIKLNAKNKKFKFNHN